MSDPAMPAAVSSPERVGLSSARLQHLDRYLQQKYLDAGRLPCAMTLIERGGQLAHLSLQGHMDVERERPLQQDTIFRIYSMTKPITSVALMMLVEEGRIALDDPVTATSRNGAISLSTKAASSARFARGPRLRRCALSICFVTPRD